MSGGRVARAPCPKATLLPSCMPDGEGVVFPLLTAAVWASGSSCGGQGDRCLQVIGRGAAAVARGADLWCVSVNQHQLTWTKYRRETINEIKEIREGTQEHSSTGNEPWRSTPWLCAVGTLSCLE
ncbi:hypothetical protein HaLaN_15673 [Haematococcus lacustris]|uniref:Uncharacterized protein n=1 Tax=Haematococcus lacustris TaxID=44745 RepID=A0A699ZS79_HAELA|nr:hypothetical protein HaLaN_15673 [Haematococcus lacustris]